MITILLVDKALESEPPAAGHHFAAGPKSSCALTSAPLSTKARMRLRSPAEHELWVSQQVFTTCDMIWTRKWLSFQIHTCTSTTIKPGVYIWLDHSYCMSNERQRNSPICLWDPLGSFGHFETQQDIVCFANQRVSFGCVCVRPCVFGLNWQHSSGIVTPPLLRWFGSSSNVSTSTCLRWLELPTMSNAD